MFQNKYLKGAGVLVVLAVIAAASFWQGFNYGQNFPKNIVIQGVANIENQTGSQADFSVFWQTWKLIEDNYLKNSEINNEERVRGAVKGLVGSLGDPYSEYLPPEDSQKFQEDISGTFGGIGAELGIRKNQLIIVAPLKNTPASRAGILAGDKILRVNASSTEGISVDQAVRWIRGEVGTEVKLLLLRDSWEEPKEFTITRELITIPTLDLEMKNGDIAYIQLYSFNANAPRLFAGAALTVLGQKSKGIILDLRNNPGGFLEVAVNVAGWFLDRGMLVVSEESRAGTEEKLYARGSGALKNIPLVILINKGSASASEILAGALRVHKGAILVGEQSFGKGTVQKILELKDGSSLKLTVAHWVLPNGEILEEKGLVPDVEVKMTEEDIKEKRDPQLDKALEILKSEIAKRNPQ
jgi:carboxyl-terminal processing protease